MSAVHNKKSRDPRRAPDLVRRPTFGLWDVTFFLDSPATSLSKADEVIFGHWDDYADEAVNVLHKMIKQTEDLAFGDDEYTDLVRTFQAFPRRPNLLNILRDNVYDEHESVVIVTTNMTHTPVQKPWQLWATKVEVIHRGLAQTMSRCMLQPAKQDEGDFGLSHLSISSSLVKTEGWTGLLHKVLDSASEPDEQPEHPTTGLEGKLQLMGV